MSPRRIVLLTGTTGFIGRHLARELAAQGYEVISLQRSEEAVDGVSERVVIPELTAAAIAAALAGRVFDVVFHLAGYGVAPTQRDVETMFRMNVDVTRSIVLQAKSWNARAVVIAGSGSEYDFAGVQDPVPETHPLEAFKLYGASKAAGSLTALAAARHLQVPLAIARLFGVFGPGEPPHRLLPAIVSGLRAGRRVALSDGTQRRDVLYVADVAAALVAVAGFVETHPQQHVINVCSGVPLTVRAFAETVADTVGAPRALLGFGDIQVRPDDVECFAGIPSRLHHHTGWKPAYSLATGLRAALDGYMLRGQI